MQNLFFECDNHRQINDVFCELQHKNVSHITGNK